MWSQLCEKKPMQERSQDATHTRNPYTCSVLSNTLPIEKQSAWCIKSNYSKVISKDLCEIKTGSKGLFLKKGRCCLDTSSYFNCHVLLLLQARNLATHTLTYNMCWQILAGQWDSHQPVVDFVKVHPLFLIACQTAHNKGYHWTVEIFTTCAMATGHKQPSHSHRKLATCRVANKNCCGLHKTQTTVYSWGFHLQTDNIHAQNINSSHQKHFCWLENRLSHIRVTIKH